MPVEDQETAHRRAGADAAPFPVAAEAGPAGGGGAPENPPPSVWRPLFREPARRDGARRDSAAEAMRAFVHRVFQTFPCYRAAEETCRGAGTDPLGDVQVLADAAGGGTDIAAAADAMAVWVRRNGVSIDPVYVGLGAAGSAYRPDFVFATTEHDSFLLIDEHGEGERPGARYICSWRGGSRAYRDDPAAAAALEGIRAVLPDPGAAPAASGQPQRAEAAGAARRRRREAAADGPEAVRPEPAAAREQEARPARRRGRQAARERRAQAAAVQAVPERPVGPAPASAGRMNPVKLFRQNGFLPAPSDQGPVMAKTLEDGTLVRIAGRDRSVAAASSFVVTRTRPGGTAETFEADSAEAALEQAGGPEGNAPPSP